MPKSVFSDRYRALLVHIIKARRTAGLTQTELAERLGKPQSYVSKAENGERRLDFVEFIELIRAVGADELEIIRVILAHPAFSSN
jgi:transcriptional regulator with XRE-family HTH domain